MNTKTTLKYFMKRYNDFEKEEKFEEVTKFFKKAKVLIEDLIKFDENKYNYPVYEQKKQEIEKKID